MKTIELSKKFELLPDEMKQEVNHFIEFLLQKVRQPGLPGDQVPTPIEELPVIWAENPDVTVLFGLRKDNPINLKQLRKDAWSR